MRISTSAVNSSSRVGWIPVSASTRPSTGSPCGTACSSTSSWDAVADAAVDGSHLSGRRAAQGQRQEPGRVEHVPHPDGLAAPSHVWTNEEAIHDLDILHRVQYSIVSGAVILALNRCPTPTAFAIFGFGNCPRPTAGKRSTAGPATSAHGTSRKGSPGFNAGRSHHADGSMHLATKEKFGISSFNTCSTSNTTTAASCFAPAARDSAAGTTRSSCMTWRAQRTIRRARSTASSARCIRRLSRRSGFRFRLLVEEELSGADVA